MIDTYNSYINKCNYYSTIPLILESTLFSTNSTFSKDFLRLLDFVILTLLLNPLRIEYW